MDRAEPRQALDDGASAPQPPAARDPEAPSGDQDGQRALPSPEPPALEQPDRPRGRHEATRRRSLGGPAGMAIAVVLASVVFAGVLATWLISSAKEAPDPPAAAGAAAATTAQGGPTSRPPGPGSFGNLVVNWSFEQDLSGWQVLGEADGSREPQGRTSGSCASVRARGPAAGPGRPGPARGRPHGREGPALCGLGLGAFERPRPAGDRPAGRRRRQGGLEDDRGDPARPGVAAGHRRPRPSPPPARSGWRSWPTGSRPATRCWSTRSSSDRDNP